MYASSTSTRCYDFTPIFHPFSIQMTLHALSSYATHYVPLPYWTSPCLLHTHMPYSQSLDPLLPPRWQPDLDDSVSCLMYKQNCVDVEQKIGGNS